MHAVLWGPLILITTLWPLRAMKGLMIALQHHHQAAEGRRGPVLLRWISSWHGAPRQLAPLTLDLALVGGVVLATTGSTTATWLMAATLLASGLICGVWKRRMAIQTQGVVWFARPFVPAVAVAGVVTWLVTSADTAVVAFISCVVVLIVMRGLLWQAIGRYRRRGAGLQRTLVVGPAHRMPHIEHRMRVFPEAGLRFAAAYVPQPGNGLTSKTGHDMVDRLLSAHQVDHVLFVVDEINERIFKDFLRFGGGRVDFSVVMPLAPISANEARAHIGDVGLIPMQLLPSWGSLAAKRVFDIVTSALLLLLISPLLLATLIAIRLDSPGRAIFSQRRVGRMGRLFTIYKFRTMVEGAEHLQADYLEHNVREHLLFKVEQDPRITRVGKWIRRLSIDELPQLVNVLRGDMSLVGPRPLAVDPEDFDPAAQIRHWAVPGITGLWQVHGANALSYQDMVELDLAYLATRSLALDLGLLRPYPAGLSRAPFRRLLGSSLRFPVNGSPQAPERSPRVLHVMEAIGGGTTRHLVDVVRHTGGVEHHVALPPPYDRGATSGAA